MIGYYKDYGIYNKLSKFRKGDSDVKIEPNAKEKLR